MYLNYYTSWSTVQIFLICLFEYEILWLENRFNTGKILKSNVKHYLFNFSIMHKFPCHWHNIVKQRSNNSGCITKITKVVEWIAEYNKKITSTSKHCNVFQVELYMINRMCEIKNKIVHYKSKNKLSENILAPMKPLVFHFIFDVEHMKIRYLQPQ